MKEKFGIFLGCVVFLGALALLTGCDGPSENLQKSRGNLTTPEVIGQTETGATVKRYHVYDPSGHDNYIYVIDNNVTSNSRRQAGKVQVPEANSTITITVEKKEKE